jgi:hypothetical protein
MIKSNNNIIVISDNEYKKNITFQSIKKTLCNNTYIVLYKGKSLQFNIDDFNIENIVIDCQNQYYFDKKTKKKNYIGIIKLTIKNNSKFSHLLNTICVLTKKYFKNNNINCEFNNIFIKVPIDNYKFSINKPIIIKYNDNENYERTYPIDMSVIKNILKNYTKNIKITLTCFTVKKNGLIFDKNIKKNKLENIINIDVNEYINFNFSIDKINIDKSNTIIDILNEVEANYNINYGVFNKLINFNINDNKNNKTIKNVTDKILDAVL